MQGGNSDTSRYPFLLLYKQL